MTLFLPLDHYFATSLLKMQKSEPQALFLAFLLALSRHGHLALDLSHLEKIVKMLPVDETYEEQTLIEMIRQGAESLPPHPAIVRENNTFYLQKHHASEVAIVSHLFRILNGSVPMLQEMTMDPKLNTHQKAAIAQALHHPLSLLTGGPGTGKTYTAACLIKIVAAQGMRVVITAPTGKAAQQLDTYLKRFLPEKTNVRAGTLHALLGLKREEDFEKPPTPLFAEIVVVDECSMIDARLFSRLLTAILPGTRLLLIGDPDQLPSVEAGSIFSDLVAAAEQGAPIPLTQLQECLRSERKELHALASSIRQGDAANISGISPIKLQALFDSYSSYFPPPFEKEPTVEELNIYFDRFRLLSCLRQGPFGVDAVNAYFASKFEEALPAAAWRAIPILITRSDYDLGLYNGDTGFLIRNQAAKDYAIFPGREKIASMALPRYELGYCLSVHKAQGSEYGDVVVLIPNGSESFGREVLYTAATRARSTVTFVGSMEVIQKVVQNSARKISGLSARIKNYFNVGRSHGV